MKKFASLVLAICACSPAFAQTATVSTNPPAYLSGSNSLSQTPSGGLRVQPQDGAGHDVSASNPFPVSLSGTSGTVSLAPTTSVQSAALASSLVVHSGASNFYSFNVSADSTLSGAAWWIMVFNATSAPADGAVTPVKCYALPTGATGASGSFPSPVTFSTGIVISVSTTGCFTKTASTHAFISADYR